MFGDIRWKLLRLMGRAAWCGRRARERRAGALRRLREAVESEAGERVSEPPRRRHEAQDEKEKDENTDGPAIKLRTRAYPLLQLLEEVRRGEMRRRLGGFRPSDG